MLFKLGLGTSDRQSRPFDCQLSADVLHPVTLYPQEFI